MIKAIQAITLSQIIWSIVVLIPVFLLFRYWIRKKNRDMKKREHEELKNFMLDLDESERIYENDDREVEYYRK